jgi:hypothetical protein
MRLGAIRQRRISVNCNSFFSFCISWPHAHLIVLSRVGGVRVTKFTGSSSDDWFYWNFVYNLS